MKTTDWFPTTRALILEMATRWTGVLNAMTPGMDPTYVAWGIPATVYLPFADQRVLTLDLFTKVEGGTATDLIKEQCREAFVLLEHQMRELHWYFTKPGFGDDRLAALGLPPRDKTKTEHPVPAVKPETTAEPSGKGKHTVTAINPVLGNKKKPPLVKGVAFAARVRAADEPKSTAESMPSAFQARTSRNFQWNEGDTGKMADYATAYENESGHRGPWSDVVSVLIA
jgi:hypothetical protein